MKWSETGLLLLALAAVLGLFLVVTGNGSAEQSLAADEEIPEEPLSGIESDFAQICFGSSFRDVPSASSDTIVKSMDLLDSIPLRQANLHITRSLRNRGIQHVLTRMLPQRGLAFLCLSREDQPLRFELNNTRR
ncbi:MAG: hypothetical protein GF388_08730 [Candidatus Aegiribacteria sp.]|nr:hypothetical protein [Candidatus Aegiribacteria sp.]MBD3295161.1 hypothetical protein [Candidatus Fermentibacteria bacterium]